MNQEQMQQMRREQEEAACTDPQTPLTAPQQQQQQTNGSNGLPENNGHLPASGDSMAMVVIRPGTSRSAKTLEDLYAIFERFLPVRLDDWVEQTLSASKLPLFSPTQPLIWFLRRSPTHVQFSNEQGQGGGGSSRTSKLSGILGEIQRLRNKSGSTSGEA